MRTPLTALVITYNEMHCIERCIASISFADEIIVVDSFSTDGTYEYLLTHPKVKVVQRPFENFTRQKSFALSKATHNWVLFVDADEEITAPLQTEIKSTLQHNTSCVAYWFRRKFMFCGKPLHFSGWQTDKNYRLFRKDKVQFSEKRMVHETLEINGKSGILKEKLIHYCYRDYDNYKSKMRHYGQLKAKEYCMLDKKFNYMQLILKPFWKFTYNYVVRLGFLDGRKGITICYLGALEVIVRYAELRKLETRNQRQAYYYSANKKSVLAE
ncbi:glycosyltransferase family 2 protein [Arenibacter sp. GZD96]|uniref:glycosyltransferase family 2 protein n=1 Tax=Aurantibrevibacter litoralis TaxID=3106030 RepID=UPI002AFF4FE4|nr:glycosyltransferase family 2 protein [Arenibacter sp. GZD-96]MEA1787123.1 glycosyltransferase family 2 protein [Arenibacter sp. GZD-96]